MHKLTVIKQNEKGSEIWRYDGHILEQNVEMIILEALFNREDTILNDIVLKRNDRTLVTRASSPDRRPSHSAIAPYAKCEALL